MRCEGARCLKRPLWSRALSAAFLLACLTLAILPSDVSAQYAALSQPRAQMAAAAAPTVALFAAGNNVGVGRVNTVDVYDAAADTWTTADLTNAVYEGAGAATSTKVIFAGGSVGSGAVLRGADIYDVSSGTWSYQASALSAGRVLLAAAGTPSRAFFAGGNGAAMYALVDIYDSVANAWSNSSMPGGPRSLLAAVALDDVVVFAGGTYPFWSPLATVDVYDLTTSGWRNVTALSAPRYALAATAVAGRFALFGGGCGTAAGAPGEGGGVTVVDMYDSISGLWTVYPNGLSVARHSLAAASVGNLAVFAGGSTSSGPVDTVDVFDLSTRTWTWGGVGALSVPRGLLSAVSVGGALLFAGGCTSWTTGPAYANVDRFTIANGTNDAQPSTITTLTNAATTVTASTASTSTSLIASTARAAASASSTATAFSTSTSLVASLTAADASTAAASTSFAASATDATSTASAAAAAALGTTTSAMASETTTGATSASPAPPAVVVVRVEGFLEVNGTWTATPGQVTIFSGNVSNTGPARIVVSGEATLAGTAVLELGSVITDTQRVRLVLATSVTGTFEAVRVRGPPGDCTRYTAHATVLPTLFAVDVQSTQRRCAPGTDRGIIILAAVIGGVFGLAIALTALIGWMDIYRPYLLPRWLARVRRLEPGDLMWR